MTPGQWCLTVTAWLIGLGAVVFAYVVQLANAMKTAAPPLSGRDAAIAISPAIFCTALLVAEYFVAQRVGNVGRAIAWNLPAIFGAGITILMVLIGWISDRPASRRSATARFREVEEQHNSDLWQNNGQIKEYELRVDRGIQKVFTTSDGNQEPGVDWHITFKVEGVLQSATVHSFPAKGQTIDLLHHSREVLQQLKRRLDSGWRPTSPEQAPLEVAVDS
jgi:hypothetical protein